MTDERLIAFMKDPSLLASITYEELKTMALAYPYANNLRVLLALKAKQINHPEAQKQIQVASAYTLSRRKLFQLIAPKVLMPEKIVEKEAVLELRPIKEVQQKLVDKVPAKKEGTQTQYAEESVPLTPEKDEAPSQEKQPAKPKKTAKKTKPVRKKPERVEQPEPASEVTPRPAVPFYNLPVLTSKPATEPEEPEAPAPVVEQEKKSPEPAKPKEEDKGQEGPTPNQLAARSVKKNEKIVSETFAKILVAQGYLDRAEKMYKQLMLLFPEKSAYFAAEIEKLKK